MIYSRIRSFAFSGIEARPVWVEVQISSGLPAFLVVGLPDKAVAEARERVRAALTAIGLALPAKRILVNLVPADLPKEGSHFDLPIALALLAAMGVIPAEEVGRYAALGELSLDGRLNPVSGVLSASLEAASMELGIACPAQQGEEALCGGDIAILAAPDLLALINHFTGLQILSSPVFSSNVSPPDTSEPDLADIKGMETGRRALEIAAAGGHSLLLSGPRGGQIHAGGTVARVAARPAAIRKSGCFTHLQCGGVIEGWQAHAPSTCQGPAPFSQPARAGWWWRARQTRRDQSRTPWCTVLGRTARILARSP